VTTFLRNLVLATLLAGLAACQSTGGAGPGAASRLLAAGYQSVAAPVRAGSSVTNIAGYICLPERCGFKSVIVFGASDRPFGTVGGTAEELVRRRQLNDRQLQALFQAFFTAGASELRITSVRQFSSPERAGFTFSGLGRGSLGETIHMRGRGILVGDNATIIVSLGDTSRTADRGMALATAD
jgi:hypothetical protein